MPELKNAKRIAGEYPYPVPMRGKPAVEHQQLRKSPQCIQYAVAASIVVID
ncbi:MAG: hypothetical protein AB1589_34190 [Cyanobacteriota bacterium]